MIKRSSANGASFRGYAGCFPYTLLAGEQDTTLLPVVFLFPWLSPLTPIDIHCPDCLERQGEGELLEPDQWADLLSQRDLSPWGDYVREFGYRGDNLGDDSAYIISAYQKKSSEQINDNLASVGLDKLL